MIFKVEKRKGLECSSVGYRTYSALCARLNDGRTIEEHYQCDIKGYDVGGTNWRLGKGKPPLGEFTKEDMYDMYLALWRRWMLEDPNRLPSLRRLAVEHDYTLSDVFARTEINQANALCKLLNEAEKKEALVYGGDLFLMAKVFKCNHLVFTSNVMLNKDGENIMGKGIAKSFKDKFPSLPKKYGDFLKTTNHRILFITQEDNYSVIAFPTKYNWRDPSDVELIVSSLRQLAMYALRLNTDEKIIMTKPGCGNGGLSWEETVKPLMEKFLPLEKIFIVDNI